MKAGWLLALALGFAAPAAAADPAQVRQAAERLYLHGMTASIAESEIGREGVPELLALLEDPSFDRPDNVVAFLAYLGGAESTKPLLASLERPLPAGASPEAVRARLLVPHALGRIAARGETAAMAALLDATADRSGGGAIVAAAKRHGYPPAIRRALEAEAVSALALAGGSVARRRLQAIAAGRVVPDPSEAALSAASRDALSLLEERGSAVPAASSLEPATPDPAASSAGHQLDFANDPALTNPATTARVDAILSEATQRAGIADYTGDVACCAAVSRTGGAGSFGSAGDGLDVIDTVTEQNAVIGNGAARVKIVTTINYCGGSGTNIVGCSYIGGKGMALVRLSSLSYEAVLWIHEYGHNLGLGHATDPRAIMYTSDNGANNGLSSGDCTAFHTPAGGAQAVIGNIGGCHDDGDDFADPVDNCPLVANEAQTDSDHDGIGDVCEACSGAGDPDGDGVCTVDDNCPTVSNPNQANFDGDPYGDACETGALRADADLSGRVDGFDLARLGRAFGASTGSSRYDVRVDFDRDGTVDGADLALLAAVFGDRSF